MNNLIEFDEYIAPDGSLYQFSDGITRFLFSFTGEGLPPIEYRTQRGPFQDGETLLDFKLLPRVIQMVHRRNGFDRQDYWDNRGDLLNLLRPNRQTAAGNRATGRLRKVLPDGTTRDINVLIEAGPRFEPRSIAEWDEFGWTETLRFIAWDPTFFDPTATVVQFLVQSFANLVFPITFPIRFFSATINQTVTVPYAGTWLTYPTITIVGPIDSPNIQNLTIGEKVQLSYSVSAGETVTIDLRPGVKTVENQAGTNLIGTVTTDSDLGTFRLEVDPIAPNGDNDILVQGGGGTTATQVNVSFLTRYIGI